MKHSKLLCFLCLAALASGCDQSNNNNAPGPPPSPPSAPPRAAQPAQARGFNNRTWYGSDSVKDLDSLLTRRNFLIVLDGSGSMRASHCSGNLAKIDAAKQAIA